ncbi:chemoreceptor glutamine deamidase CheD [Chitinimonas sp. BJYL2]|uniref:chemoreceptor glutamine deamidase CheD n=1 Tax=Chitinimonas sp. BJYL2 TaxID=2976696 RepID=UPI0022B5C4EE|nr:chemoreceptor glutamine deamidase CheD [Chitinimonas sp. BJYL2]
MSNTRHEKAPPNRYFDKHFGRDAAKILPGEYYATGRGTLLVTVLGSCIAVCLRDPFNGVAGINHFMLPEGREERPDPLVGLPTRYGAFAMEALFNDMLKLGAERRHMEAKIFGGANVMQSLEGNHVGRRNVEFIRRYLHNENIRIVAEDLLGNDPRKIYFFSDEGKVKVKRLRVLNNDTILQRELEYRAHLLRDNIEGSVELF